MEKRSYWAFAFFIIVITLMFAINMQAPLNPYIEPVGMLVLVCLGSFIILLFILKNRKFPFIIDTIIAFGTFAILSTIINGDYMDNNLIMTICVMIFWIIIFISSYIFSMENKNSQVLFNIIALTLPFIGYLYYQIYQIQVNSVYYILLFFPIILTIKQKYIKASGIFVIFCSVIISLKRTALVAIVLSFTAFFILSLRLTKKRRNISKIIPTLIFLLFVSVGIIFLYNFLTEYLGLNWIIRMQSLQTDGGSGRDIVWATTIKMQFYSSPFEWLFGHGFDAVLQDSPLKLTAHNDFLEVLYDYGIIALAIYLSFIILLIKTLIRMYKSGFSLSAPFSSSLVIFLVMSTTSHLVIYPTYFIYLAFFWGTSIAQYENYRNTLMSDSRTNGLNSM